jgi:hypothetical protein
VGNTCTNSTTGPFSDNICSITNTSTIKVNNVNDAIIKNDVVSNSNTGGNSASYNTLGGSVKTGNAMTTSAVSSVANVNTTKVTGGAAASGNAGVNEITGPESTNQTFITNVQDVNVLNSNTATVDNKVRANSNTGRNLADYNTGPATVDTGDAGLVVTVGNHVNDNLTEIQAGAGGTGGNVAKNLTTGPFSTNIVSLTNINRARVKNVNDLIVDNDVAALANTGDNTAKKNTLGGDITTGDADNGVGVDTEGNINTTKIHMAMGGFSNEGVNSVTGPAGPDGDPGIFITNTVEAVVQNWNNKCKSHNASRLGKKGCDVSDLGIENKVRANSVTGENLADYNTGGGSVESGMAELLQQVLSHLNDTFTEIVQ